MVTIRCYTRPGMGIYPEHNYPGHTAKLCDLEHAMHLAYSTDGVSFHPLRNDTGILFPRCTFDEGKPEGTTKTLIDPMIFRDKNGQFLVCAIRRDQNGPDPLTRGSIMLFTSPDLVHYEESGFLLVSDHEIRRPSGLYDSAAERYVFAWDDVDGRLCGWTADFRQIHDVHSCDAVYDARCEIDVTDAELSVIRDWLDEITQVGVQAIEYQMPVGGSLSEVKLLRARCLYSDGSYHDKQVDWDEEALQAVDTSRPGTYTIPGTIRMKHWENPCHLGYGSVDPADINDPNVGRGMSDPCVTFYRGKYYLTSTGIQNIAIRCADTVSGVFGADPVVICRIPLRDHEHFSGTWAAELHEIDGTLYMFTTICPGGDWTKVAAVVLRCTGDPCAPDAWDAPCFCVKPDGRPCTESGISLDMTYIHAADRHYVLWSDRKIYWQNGKQIVAPADIYIASIDPAAPWQMTSWPSCIARPVYGWERCETEVVEAPYLLRHGDDLFVTISGSSTGMADLYATGIMQAHCGDDLTDPGVWRRIGYPLLTKESVPGEYGPGHNNFVIDHETGDTLMVYHAVPHDDQDRTLGRQPYVRRVHWSKAGYPYLEMTPQRDLKDEFRHVTMTLTLKA